MNVNYESYARLEHKLIEVFELKENYRREVKRLTGCLERLEHELAVAQSERDESRKDFDLMVAAFQTLKDKIELALEADDYVDAIDEIDRIMRGESENNPRQDGTRRVE